MEDLYRGTSLIRKRLLPRTTIGPQAQPYCRVSEVFSYARGFSVGQS